MQFIMTSPFHRPLARAFLPIAVGISCAVFPLAASAGSSSAVDDSYTATVNTPLYTGSYPGATAPSTEANDTLDLTTYPQEGVCPATGPSHEQNHGMTSSQFTLYSDGSFKYTPDTDYVGSDSFTYTLCDDPSSSSPVVVAGPATVTITVEKASQTITFAALPAATYGDADSTVSATASSGLPVSFAASGACTLSSSTLHVTGAGTCTVTASQAGDATYLTAPDVTRALAVSPRPLNVTASAQDKTYDGSADATVTLTTDALSGDTVTPSDTAATFSDAHAGTDKTVTVSGISIGGASAADYALQDTSTTTMAAITAAALTVTAADASKNVGDADPALSYTVTSGQLYGSDALTGALARDPGDTAGRYAITQGTLAASADYALTFVPGTLSINAAPVAKAESSHAGSLAFGVAPNPLPGATPAIGSVLGASVYRFTHYLGLGSTGTDVTELQKVLIAGGFLQIPAPTGYFGAQTHIAVLNYQKANEVSGANGHVGPATLALLNRGSAEQIPVVAANDNELRLQIIANLKLELASAYAALDTLLAEFNAQKGS
ncbi:peptidoglycan-binding protein [Patescibacteria group bacterium]|nr:peptidoglycan-binding protein [Patescibacteria group bacterium]